MLIVRFGFPWAYGIDLVTIRPLFLAAFLIRPMPPEHDPDSAVGLARPSRRGSPS